MHTLTKQLLSKYIKKSTYEELCTSIKSNNSDNILSNVTYIKCYQESETLKEKILLVHGTNSSISSFLKLVDDMTFHYDLYLINLPGFGECDFNIDIRSKSCQETLELYNHVLKEFIITNKLEGITLLGHSFGGYLCTYFSHHHETLTNKLILLNPAGIFSFGSNCGLYVATLFKIGFPQQFIRLIPCFIINFITRFLFLDYAYDLKLMSLQNNISYYIIKKFLSISKFESYVEYPLLPMFSNLKVPVGLIYNSNDEIMPMTHGLCLSKTFDIPLNIVEDSGHSIQYSTNITLLVNAIIDILQKCRIPKSRYSPSFLLEMNNIRTGFNIFSCKKKTNIFFGMLSNNKTKLN